MELRCIYSNSRNFKVGNIYQRSEKAAYTGSFMVDGDNGSIYFINGVANGYNNMTVCVYNHVLARFEAVE